MAAIGGVLLGGLEVIGLVGGLLGSFGVLQSLTPDKKDNAHSIRIGVGHESDFEASLSGDIPGITIWDEFGRLIGLSEGGGHVDQGTLKTVEIVGSQGISSPKADYLSLTASGDDAVCIAYAVVTYPDGTFSSFTGDIAKECGAPWHESRMVLGITGETPVCFWLDKNRSNGLPYQGMALHLRDFANNKALAGTYNENKDMMCKSGPRFRMYEEMKAGDPVVIFDPPLEYEPPVNGTDKDPERILNDPGVPSGFDNGGGSILDRIRLRARHEAIANTTGFVTVTVPDRVLQARETHTAAPDGSTPSSSPGAGAAAGRKVPPREQLIISNLSAHSARRLCESETSWGPDFVSLRENLYCDMDKKQLYDVCSGTSTECCFNTETEKLESCFTTMNTNSTDFEVASVKKYGQVSKWDD